MALFICDWVVDDLPLRAPSLRGVWTGLARCPLPPLFRIVFAPAPGVGSWVVGAQLFIVALFVRSLARLTNDLFPATMCPVSVKCVGWRAALCRRRPQRYAGSSYPRPLAWARGGLAL